MLQTKSSRLCADGGGSFIPLLEARRDSCAHGTRIANVSTSFAAICGFVPSRLLCRRGNHHVVGAQQRDLIDPYSPLEVGDQDLWYPTSREKRARCGARRI